MSKHIPKHSVKSTASKPKYTSSSSKNNQDDSKKKLILILSIVVLVLMVAILAAVVFINGGFNFNTTETTAPVTTVATTAPASTADEATTAPQATQTTSSAVEVVCPDELAKYLEKNSSSVEELTKAECKQLVVVNSSTTSANIKFYECDNNEWQENTELACNGFVGAKGVVEEMSEYINGTPKGLYTIDEAFYIYDKPKTGLETFEITNNTYWVDDPDSKYYNKRVEGTADKDWNSAEHMVDYTSYKYGFVIGYNHECKKAAGSAIFFHIGDSPTMGCIATSQDTVLAYLAQLDASKNPYILIV